MSLKQRENNNLTGEIKSEWHSDCIYRKGTAKAGCKQ